jgi:hypothetical protein
MVARRSTVSHPVDGVQEHILDPLLEVLAQYRTPSNLKVSDTCLLYITICG